MTNLYPWGNKLDSDRIPSVRALRVVMAESNPNFDERTQWVWQEEQDVIHPAHDFITPSHDTSGPREHI